MKTVILCGGIGYRLKEETEFKPKPMVLVGGKPILWHIMKTYAHFGFNEFVLTLGYKGQMIKDYFNKDYDESDNFKLNYAATGLNSLTGERILRSAKYLTGDEFMVTYGDGVSDLDIQRLVDFHKKQGTLGTITAIHPKSKYGLVGFDRKTNLVTSFNQKPLMDDYISAGFMVFKKEALKYFDNGPMENALSKLMSMKQLSVFKYEGFWKAMDTYREMQEMNELWKIERPWAIWENK